MPVVIKVDPDRIVPAANRTRSISGLRILKDDDTPSAGDSVFVWFDYSSPSQKDGRLEECGMLISIERSDDRKSLTCRYSICNSVPVRDWLTEDLDALKTSRRDEAGEQDPRVEIANKVRLYTLDHIESVTLRAAEEMSAYFD